MKFATTATVPIPICSKCNRRMILIGGSPNIMDQWRCEKCGNRIADLEIDAKAAERLAKITPDTKLLTHDEVFCKIK